MAGPRPNPDRRAIRAALGWLALFGLAASLAPAAPADDPPEDAKALFLMRVRPMLREKCLNCHGEGEEIEAHLDLRTREAMLKGGDGGPALVPGKPAESLIYKSVLRDGPIVMPPRKANRLTERELADLRAWIEAGAPWAEPEPIRIDP
jgi:mono/diheme cytochrome c family protein